MKTKITTILVLLLLACSVKGQPTSNITPATKGVSVLANGTIASPTNFFIANADAIAAATSNALRADLNPTAFSKGQINTNDTAVKWANNVGVVNLNTITGSSGYTAKDLATPTYIGQIATSDYGYNNLFFWRANSTTQGDWTLLFSIADGAFVAGDPFAMKINTGSTIKLVTMGNPSVQNYAQRAIDAQVVSLNMNPYSSGGGFNIMLVGTNVNGSAISTNSSGQKIYIQDPVACSFVVSAAQADEFVMPSVGQIVQNGNRVFAIANSFAPLGYSQGNYSWLQTRPTDYLTDFPWWQNGVWRPTNSNWRSAFTINHATAIVTAHSNLVTKGDLIITNSSSWLKFAGDGAGEIWLKQYNLFGGVLAFAWGPSKTERLYLSSTNLYPQDRNVFDLGKPSFEFRTNYSLTVVTDRVKIGSIFHLSGSGTPEGSVTAPVGSLYTRTDGGANTTLYVKESGTGNTGWIAK